MGPRVVYDVTRNVFSVLFLKIFGDKNFYYNSGSRMENRGMKKKKLKKMKLQKGSFQRVYFPQRYLMLCWGRAHSHGGRVKGFFPQIGALLII